MALSVEIMALLVETMALSVGTMALSAETIALSVETMALQNVALDSVAIAITVVLGIIKTRIYRELGNNEPQRRREHGEIRV
ncbi:hypothetical protein [Nostoc sp.]|uniref:hypothetical protein n=1 Tax=Nostoc sp. TaxID=1180 RepID=UPI002FFBA33F